MSLTIVEEKRYSKNQEEGRTHPRIYPKEIENKSIDQLQFFSQMVHSGNLLALMIMKEVSDPSA